MDDIESRGFAEILLRVDGPIATVTLNRPQNRNAWTVRLDAELAHAMALCNDDDTIRAVILTGAGDTFCVGADLSGRDIAAPGEESVGERAIGIAPHDMCKPVIAAMNGHAVGIGLTYPLHCDIRIVSETAKVGGPFVRRGVISELNGHWLLPRLVGFSVAADLLLTGRLISGTEAAAIGLCSVAVPAAEVVARATALAHEIAENTAPASVAISKRLLWEGLESSSRSAEARERELFSWLASGPDAAEGVASFLDRRPPQWTLPPSTPIPPASAVSSSAISGDEVAGQDVDGVGEIA